MGTDPSAIYDGYAATLIRQKARSLIGRYGFRNSDREDIEQELSAALLKRCDRFDPTKGRSSTFVRMVVKQQVATLIRNRRVRSRDDRQRVSGSTPGDRDSDLDKSDSSYDDRDILDLVLDTLDVIGMLDPELGKIAIDLCHIPLAAAARKHGCSREAMRNRARKIRRLFEAKGLDVYIPPTNSASRRVSNR